MANRLAPVYVDGERVVLHGQRRPTMQKVMQECGVDEGTFDVWRLDGPDDKEGELVGRADVLDRTVTDQPIYLRLQKSDGHLPDPDEGTGMAATPALQDESAAVPDGPGSVRRGKGIRPPPPAAEPGALSGRTGSYATSGQSAIDKFGPGVQENPLGPHGAGAPSGSSRAASATPLGGDRPSRRVGKERGRGDALQLPGDREWLMGVPTHGSDAERKDVSSRRDRPETRPKAAKERRAARRGTRSGHRDTNEAPAARER